MALAAAAALLLAVLIGVETNRKPPAPARVEVPEVVHETGENVILVLREGGNPIYIAVDWSENTTGGRR